MTKKKYNKNKDLKIPKEWLEPGNQRWSDNTMTKKKKYNKNTDLKIPKGWLEHGNQRWSDNTMTKKIYNTNNNNKKDLKMPKGVTRRRTDNTSTTRNGQEEKLKMLKG